MRFISFKKNNETYAGLELVGEGVIQLTKIDKSIPNSINEIIKNYSQFEETIQKVNDKSNIHYSCYHNWCLQFIVLCLIIHVVSYCTSNMVEQKSFRSKHPTLNIGPL